MTPSLDASDWPTGRVPQSLSRSQVIKRVLIRCTFKDPPPNRPRTAMLYCKIISNLKGQYEVSLETPAFK